MFQSEVTLVFSLLTSGSAYLLGAGEGMGRFVEISIFVNYNYCFYSSQTSVAPHTPSELVMSTGPRPAPTMLRVAQSSVTAGPG